MSFSDINYWYLFRFFPTEQLGKIGGAIKVDGINYLVKGGFAAKGLG
jgi:hypothetical protein